MLDESAGSISILKQKDKNKIHMDSKKKRLI
jgi:hypothetical protein